MSNWKITTSLLESVCYAIRVLILRARSIHERAGKSFGQKTTGFRFYALFRRTRTILFPPLGDHAVNRSRRRLGLKQLQSPSPIRTTVRAENVWDRSHHVGGREIRASRSKTENATRFGRRPDDSCRKRSTANGANPTNVSPTFPPRLLARGMASARVQGRG